MKSFFLLLYDVSLATIIVEIIIVLALVVILLFDKVYYTVDWELLKQKRRNRKCLLFQPGTTFACPMKRQTT